MQGPVSRGYGPPMHQSEIPPAGAGHRFAIGWFAWLGAALLAFASLFASAPAAAVTKGSWQSRGETCFDTRSKTVPEVCATLRVHWSLSSLMGEPVANYGLDWQITRVSLAGKDGLPAASHRIESLPEPLAKAARASEMMAQGLAWVDSGEPGILVLAFDTGAPTRANGEVSFNVASSPDWSEWLFRLFTGDRLNSRCKPGSRAHLSADQAKKVFKAGMRLDGFVLCPDQTSVNVGSLENALYRYCQKGDSGLAFCPGAAGGDTAGRPGKGGPNDQIDAAFTALEAGPAASRTKAAQPRSAAARTASESSFEARLKAADVARADQLEREAEARRQRQRQQAAQKYCEGALAKRATCMREGCRNEPEKEICTDSRRVEGSTSGCAKGAMCLSFPTFVCHATKPNPEHARWQACMANPVATCAGDGSPGSKAATAGQCVQQRLAAGI